MIWICDSTDYSATCREGGWVPWGPTSTAARDRIKLRSIQSRQVCPVITTGGRRRSDCLVQSTKGHFRLKGKEDASFWYRSTRWLKKLCTFSLHTHFVFNESREDHERALRFPLGRFLTWWKLVGSIDTLYLLFLRARCKTWGWNNLSSAQFSYFCATSLLTFIRLMSGVGPKRVSFWGIV